MTYYGADSKLPQSPLEEFQVLRQAAQAIAQRITFEAALDPVNYRRNRYRDVLANDDTRVRLGCRAGSDYINANFIGNFAGTSNTYIACQAPLPATFGDFWRMVWEQNAPLIVMLTPLVEKSRVKAHQYWPGPGETERYGPFTVRSHSTTIYKNITIRKFWVTAEDQTREIVQLHYEEWRDMGVPERPSGLLTLVDVANKFLKRSGSVRGVYGPAVVHCSAGIGRTGTFIAVDIAIQQFLSFGRYSVMDIVHTMREQRFGMVQTEEQYLFIYRAMEEWLSKLQHSQTPIASSSISVPTTISVSTSFVPAFGASSQFSVTTSAQSFSETSFAGATYYAPACVQATFRS